QQVPDAPAGMRACCARCGCGLRRRSAVRRSNQLAGAFALAALILYPLAVTLPMIRVEQFGWHNESSILTGTAALIASGHVIVGLVVLVCSVVLPLGKLISMLVLVAGGVLMRREHKALT